MRALIVISAKSITAAWGGFDPVTGILDDGECEIRPGQTLFQKYAFEELRDFLKDGGHVVEIAVPRGELPIAEAIRPAIDDVADTVPVDLPSLQLD